MEIINTQILKKMNFSDYDVLNVLFDKEAKSITFNINGGWYLNASKRVELGNGYLHFKDYKSITITAYDAVNDVEWLINENNFEQLREISEIDVSQNNVVIKGFAKNTSNWLEYNITGGAVNGEFISLSGDK